MKFLSLSITTRLTQLKTLNALPVEQENLLECLGVAPYLDLVRQSNQRDELRSDGG
ncbi:hypothetical protein [Nostoc sp. PCC 7524]|uniref:hypothetical protein n=1 Tax=Nostoc sp. (strain ATCC 29411 / PCC 7524) TaxID=28072 RepID=UPI003FA37185